MAFEYIDEIVQSNYTIEGITDEIYPAFNIATIYPKNTNVIYQDKIYSSNTTIPRATYYVYNKLENSLYIPSTATFVSTATFSATNEFEKRYIFLDDTDTLYKYKGLTDLTIAPSLIDFTKTTLWQNEGKQLNGYTSEPRYPQSGSIYWNDLGFINSKRAFDSSNPSQTVSNINVPLKYIFTTGKVNRIALFNLDANDVTIKVHLGTEPESTNNTITTDYPLYKREGLHFYEILTSEVFYKKNTYIEIPTASTQTITVTISRDGGFAKLGDITLGKARQIGATLDGVEFDIKDYSTYGSDSSTSDEYTEGGYRKVSSFTVSVLNKGMEEIERQLNNLRGKITVFNIDTTATTDYTKFKGFIRNRPINYVGNSLKSKINIKIEGRIE